MSVDALVSYLSTTLRFCIKDLLREDNIGFIFLGSQTGTGTDLEGKSRLLGYYSTTYRYHCVFIILCSVSIKVRISSKEMSY